MLYVSTKTGELAFGVRDVVKIFLRNLKLGFIDCRWEVVSHG